MENNNMYKFSPSRKVIWCRKLSVDGMTTKGDVDIYKLTLDKLRKLRSIDRLVDMSKSTIQFDILLALGEKEMSTSEITRYIGQRRKATTDALRKLKKKGLIEIVSNDRETTYKLGESGMRCYHDLMEIVGFDEPCHQLRNMQKEKNHSSDMMQFKLDLQKDRGNFNLTNVVSEMILALGTAKGNAMYLKDLAKVVNLSEQRAESYLKLYMDGEHRLFRRFIDSWGKGASNSDVESKTSTKVMYALTNEGLQYFYKMPIYARLRGSLAYNFLSRITLTSQPRHIFRRLALLIYVGGVSSLAAMIFPFGFLLTGLWLFLTAIIGTIMASGFIF